MVLEIDQSQSSLHGGELKRFSQRLVNSATTGGVAVGLMLGILTLYYQQVLPDGGLDFLQIVGIRGAVISVSMFTVAHAVFGAGVGVLTMLIFGALNRRVPEYVPAAAAFALGIGMYVTAYFFVSSNLALPANVSLHDPVRGAALWRSALYGVASLMLVAAVAVPIFKNVALRVGFRWAIAILAITSAVSAYGLIRWNLTGVRYSAFDTKSPVPETDTNRVVIIGVDGGSWQLLDRFFDEGLLPNLERVRRTGVAANLVTHGQRLSPAVWTGVATGWSHSEHGIRSFMVPEPSTGSIRSVESKDRLKPAVWQMLSEFGRRSVVLNWYASYPAERIDGAIVSRLVDLDEHAVQPDGLLPTIESSLAAAEESTGHESDAKVGVEGIFDLAERSLREWQPDLLMVYVPWTDWYQHIHWVAFEPEEFGEEWEVTDDQVRSGREELRDIWTQVDQRIGELMDVAGENTSFLIISDHGFKPRSKILAYLRPNDLLNAMGYLQWVEGEEGTIDFAATTAFSGQADTYEGMLRIAVNVIGRQGEGIVPEGSRVDLAKRIAAELSSLRVKETGESLFLNVGLATDGVEPGASFQGFDIFAEFGAPLRTAGSNRTVEISSTEIKLDDLLTIMRNNTGNHSPRGILLATGPGFRQTEIVPLIADSPYTDAVTYVTGYIKRLEGMYHLLRVFGCIDPYTTIDITPTILYLLGLPISEEMEGKLIERAFLRDYIDGHPARVIDSYGYLEPNLSPETEGTESEETLEKLRALGYIQ